MTDDQLHTIENHLRVHTLVLTAATIAAGRGVALPDALNEAAGLLDRAEKLARPIAPVGTTARQRQIVAEECARIALDTASCVDDPVPAAKLGISIAAEIAKRFGFSLE